MSAFLAGPAISSLASSPALQPQPNLSSTGPVNNQPVINIGQPNADLAGIITALNNAPAVNGGWGVQRAGFSMSGAPVNYAPAGTLNNPAVTAGGIGSATLLIALGIGGLALLFYLRKRG